MVEARERARLALAAVAVAGERSGRQQLERDVAVEPLVARAVHDAHPALADLLDEAEMSERAAQLVLALGWRDRAARHGAHTTTGATRSRAVPRQRTGRGVVARSRASSDRVGSRSLSSIRRVISGRSGR